MKRQLLAVGRRHVEALASSTGEYIVVCARTGTRPVPVAGKRFPDRRSAVAAATVATLYRAHLRRYDERTTRYDLVACQEPAVSSTHGRTSGSPTSHPGETA
jgi:hypothetical protein